MNYYDPPASVIDLPESGRAAFIRRTYAHLAGALAAFALVATLIINSPIGHSMARMMTGGKWAWLVVLGVFMLVSHIAHSWAASATRRSTQYLGLGVFVLLEALIFCPLLLMAKAVDAAIIPKAALITGGLFLGLTWIAFSTRKDFSFMGGVLKLGFMIALGVIVASIVFGFSLGVVFSFIMVALLGAAVLYETSNVIHHYGTSQDVAASLALFGSFTTMLWYIIQILISFAGDD
jgi:FtsH-binding integral membrane protein